MSGRDLFQAYAPVSGAPRGAKRAVAAQQSPRENRLLAALPPDDYERLRPALEPVPLPAGWTVHRAGEREKYLYFPTAGIVSKSYMSANGTSTEFALTGREGVIGVATILGGESMLSEAVVLSAGHAYRLGAEQLKKELQRRDQLLPVLLRYTQALIGQTGQIAACNRHHTVEQQLCRCILTILDRLPSNDVALTQELIADNLGVRRESVTDAAGKLQRAGLIHYSRGHIIVPDRALLEAHACECYAAVKREYQRLLPPEDARADAGVQAVEFRDACSTLEHAPVGVFPAGRRYRRPVRSHSTADIAN